MEEQVVDEKKRKRLETLKRYRQNNREKIREKNKRYRLKNRETINEKKKPKAKQYRLKNKENISEYQKEYYLENKETLKEKHKNNHLKRKYDITLDDYNKMLLEQDGKCYTCSVKAEDTQRKYLCVDHNHLTGEVRGLLCDLCNTALGLLKENQETIANLSKYLHEKGSCVLKEVG
jgi:hypothetical protein